MFVWIEYYEQHLYMDYRSTRTKKTTWIAQYRGEPQKDDMYDDDDRAWYFEVCFLLVSTFGQSSFSEHQLIAQQGRGPAVEWPLRSCRGVGEVFGDGQRLEHQNPVASALAGLPTFKFLIGSKISLIIAKRCWKDKKETLKRARRQFWTVNLFLSSIYLFSFQS